VPRSRCEQRRQQLASLGLLRRGERLQPRRLEHDLPTLGSWAQRHQLAAATRIRFQHSVLESPSYIPMRFSTPVLDKRARKIYAALTACAPCTPLDGPIATRLGGSSFHVHTNEADRRR
jgi:hypothetical protein